MEVDPPKEAAERTMEAALTTHREAYHLPTTTIDNPTGEDAVPRANGHEMTWRATPPNTTVADKTMEAVDTTREMPLTTRRDNYSLPTVTTYEPTEESGYEMTWRAEFTVGDANRHFVLDSALLLLFEPLFQDEATFNILSPQGPPIDSKASFPVGQEAMGRYFEWHKNGHTWFVGFRVLSSKRLEEYKNNRDINRHMKDLGVWLEEHHFASLDLVLAGWYKDRHPDWYHRKHTQQRLQQSIGQHYAVNEDDINPPHVEVTTGTIGRSFQAEGDDQGKHFRTRVMKIVCDRRSVRQVRNLLTTTIKAPDSAGIFVPWGGNTGIPINREIQFIASNNIYQLQVRRVFVHNILPDSLNQPTVDSTTILRDQILQIKDSQGDRLFDSVECTNHSATKGTFVFIYKDQQEEYALEYIDQYLPELCKKSTKEAEAKRRYAKEPRRHHKGYDQSKYADDMAANIYLPSLAEAAAYATPPKRNRPPHMITLHNPYGKRDSGRGRHGDRGRGRGGSDRRPTQPPAQANTTPQNHEPPTLQNHQQDPSQPSQPAPVAANAWTQHRQANTQPRNDQDALSLGSVQTTRTDNKSLETVSALSTQMTAIQSEQKRMTETMSAMQQERTDSIDRFLRHSQQTQELSVAALDESRQTNAQLQKLLALLMTNAVISTHAQPAGATLTQPDATHALPQKGGPAVSEPTTPSHRHRDSQTTEPGSSESTKRPAAQSPATPSTRAPPKRPMRTNPQTLFADTGDTTQMDLGSPRRPPTPDSDTDSWTGRFSPVREMNG